ncbi:MAG TPA: GntR family transcriptional regulator [Nocardioidaceae bacterium]|jgi:DNA-binding transcriptional regulator YhcF (GntR family)|nr:GntR family transcriptional regulator [Nocardioidaceae bacterium]
MATADLDDLAIDPGSPTPPFEQVRSGIAARVASGALPAGTRLPPVRALAGSLGLAVNTVARVYRELEADAVVVTEGRRGTFVRGTAADGDGAAARAAREYAALARKAGLTREQALLLVERGWSSGNP